jgi:hypothetical protein
MDEGEKKKDLEEKAAENHEDQDWMGEEDSDGEQNQEKSSNEHENASPSLLRKIGFRKVVDVLLSHKWLFLCALSLLFIFMGVNITLSPKKVKGRGDTATGFVTKKIMKEQADEENLSPLYIPFPGDSPKCMIRVEVSATWNSSASARYKKKELLIRDQLYRHLSELVKGDDDLDGKTMFLEAEINRIVKKIMGPIDLEIKIKEIKYI